MNASESIRECGTSREILEYLLGQLKEKSRQPLKELAQLAGYRSASAMCMVMKGKRGFSPTSAQRLADNLALDKNSAQYLCTMANLEAAKSTEERLRYHETLLYLRTRHATSQLELMQYRFLAIWYYPAIFAMAAGDNLKMDAKQIGIRLGRDVTEKMVKTAIGDLLGLKLLELNDGVLKQMKGAVQTSDGIKNLAIQRYHRDMLQLAADSIALPVDKRYLSGLTAMVPKSLEGEVKKRMLKFCEELNELVTGASEGEVFQINLQLFPLTSSPEAPSE